MRYPGAAPQQRLSTCVKRDTRGVNLALSSFNGFWEIATDGVAMRGAHGALPPRIFSSVISPSHEPRDSTPRRRRRFLTQAAGGPVSGQTADRGYRWESCRSGRGTGMGQPRQDQTRDPSSGWEHTPQQRSNQRCAAPSCCRVTPLGLYGGCCCITPTTLGAVWGNVKAAQC